MKIVEILDDFNFWYNLLTSTFTLFNWFVKIGCLFCLADDVHTVYVETDDNPRVILCHLSKASKLYQCRLDHIFPRGTDLKFVTTATANIHMTGIYFIWDID